MNDGLKLAVYSLLTGASLTATIMSYESGLSSRAREQELLSAPNVARAYALHTEADRIETETAKSLGLQWPVGSDDLRQRIITQRNAVPIMHAQADALIDRRSYRGIAAQVEREHAAGNKHFLQTIGAALLTGYLSFGLAKSYLRARKNQ